MKLDKIDPNQKKKSKKGIIIGTSTVAALAIASICGCTLLRGANNDVLKVAQHLVSGPVLQRALEDKKEDDDEDWGESQTPTTIPTVSKEVAKQVETLLDRLGFGFSRMTTIDISLNDVDATNLPDNYEFATEKNGSNNFIYLEGVYCLAENIDITKKPERPEPYQGYNGNSGNTTLDDFKNYPLDEDGNPKEPNIEDYYDYLVGLNPEQVREMYDDWVEAGRPDDEGWDDKTMKIFKEFDRVYVRYTYINENWEKYQAWMEWITARNEWISAAYRGERFDRTDPDDVYDGYTNFWVCIAQKALNVSGVNIKNMDEDDVNKVIEKLLAQVYTGEVLDGEFVERENISPNLFRDILLWQFNGANDNNKPNIYSEIDGLIDEFWTPDTSGETVPGVDGGDSGGSGGGGSGGGSGGETGGGSGGETGGGSGGEGGSGGDGGEEKPDETTPLEVKSLAITSPLKSSIYRAGQEIKLKVTFSKNIYATAKKVAITKATAPSLYISFVDEANGQTNSNVASKQATFESVSGRNLVYTYKIAEGDNGRLVLGQGDNFKGTVYDESGKMLLLTKIEEMSETPIVVADTISPSVQSIEAISEERSYQTGEEIEIKVTFTEKVYGNDSRVPLLTKTVPKLNISFGDGKVKNPTIKTINESEHYLVYRYIIQSDDRGTLKVNPAQAFDGSQNIYDSVGNGTVLVAGPALTGSNISANADLAVVTLNKTEITLDLNGTKEETLVATTKPEGLELTWSVADDKVATVDSKTGKVTAVAIGETIVTATAPDGTTATCKVTVKDTTKGETKLTLNKTQLELDLSGTKEEQLKATVEPTDMEVTWTSSNIKVATVDSKTGKVTAVGVGSATITAKAQDGTTASCKVTVTDSAPTEIEPTGIEFLTVNPSVVLGRTSELQMQTRLIPSNCNTNMGITYESSNESVATIDPNGKVTIKVVGTTVITATTENGKSVSTNLTVIEMTSENDVALGDVTGDTKIDSSDLLAMLRHVAVSSSSDIKAKHQDWLIQGDTYAIADIDGNGRIDITDVLKLQRHIAYTKSEVVQQKHPDWEIKSDWVTVNAVEPVQESQENLQVPEGQEEEKPGENQEETNANDEVTAEIYDVNYSEELEKNPKVLLSSKEEMDTYLQTVSENENDMAMVTAMSDKYDEEYFKEKSLALVYVVMPSEGVTVEYEGSSIQDNIITVQYKVNELEEGTVGATVMTASFIVLEVDKDITEIK